MGLCISGCGSDSLGDAAGETEGSTALDNDTQVIEETGDNAELYDGEADIFTPAEDAPHAGEVEYALRSAFGYVNVSSESDTDEVIKTIRMDGYEYLFLPAAVDFSEITFGYDLRYGLLSIVNGEELVPIVSGMAMDITPFLSDDIGDGSHILNVMFTDVYGESINRQIFVLKGSQIAAMFITSDDPENEGRAFLDSGKDNETTAGMTMLSATGDTIYAGHLKSIRARGNNTYMADKKPYQIKLEEKIDLLESGNSDNADKTWLLLANARDASFVRNSVALDLASRMGLDVEEFRPVDLYYDGEYHGCHLLCEKVERGDGRLKLSNLEKANKEANESVDLSSLSTVEATNKYGNAIQYVDGMNTPEDFHKGYLIESDVSYYNEENGWFTLSTGSQFGIKYPKYPSKEEVEFISEYMEEALIAAQNGGVNAVTGKSVWEYLDKDSFVKNYVLNEVVGNPDAYASSGFMYMNDEDGPLISGPAWDFDTAYGIGEIAMAPDALRVSDGWIEWSVIVCSLPDFRSAVKDYYDNTGYQLASEDAITPYVDEIRDSMKMDRIFCSKSLQAWCKQETYEADVNFLRDYATNRREWFKETVDKW